MQVLYGSCLGNANSYSNTNLPLILAGDSFKHLGHLAFYEHNKLLANHFVTMLQRLGVETDCVATNSGTLQGMGGG